MSKVQCPKSALVSLPTSISDFGLWTYSLAEARRVPHLLCPRSCCHNPKGAGTVSQSGFSDGQTSPSSPAAPHAVLRVVL
jgi:hypothetical protein